MTGAVNAVTGAVAAVTWGRDPALDVTGTVPAVIAVAGCHSPSRRADRPGHVLLATLGSLAHVTLACATEVATALRDTRRYARSGRYPLHRCRSSRWSRTDRVAGHVPRATPRSRLRSKMSQGRNGPAAGQGCHAATGARIVPWRQPGDWLINLPIASTALFRSEPDLWAGARSPLRRRRGPGSGSASGGPRRRGGGRSSGARARLAVKAAGGR